MGKDVNWEHVRVVWDNGVESLQRVAESYNITVAEISLKAAVEKWPDRGINRPLVPTFDSPVLDDRQVILAHKTDLGRLRLFAACVIESMQGSNDAGLILKNTERLAKIYAQLIPLERITFGIDNNLGDSPDTIIITRKG